MENKPDKRVVACNYCGSEKSETKYIKPGTLCYLLPNWGVRCEMLVRSRGGRHVKRWGDFSQFNNYRLKTIPPEHPLYDWLIEWGSHPIPQGPVSV